MGIPFYHTDESALEVVKDYQAMHGLDSIEDALIDMEFCIDDLDREDRSAFRHVMRLLVSKSNKC
jgi:hypothetical protein